MQEGGAGGGCGRGVREGDAQSAEAFGDLHLVALVFKWFPVLRSSRTLITFIRQLGGGGGGGPAYMIPVKWAKGGGGGGGGLYVKMDNVPSTFKNLVCAELT